MGQLINKILNSIAGGQKESRILMLGLDGAGKTTILYKLKLGEAVASVPTIGFNVEKVQYKKLTMVIWDIGGQDRLRQLWHHYFVGTQAIIYVIDTSDEERMKLAQETVQYLMADQDLNELPLLIFANKVDLSHKNASTICKELQLYNLKNPWYVQETVALTGDGLYEGLNWLNDTLSKRK